MTDQPQSTAATEKAVNVAETAGALSDRPATVVIENVSPVVDCGRHGVKRIVGDAVQIGADIYKDGHDLIAARILFRRPDEMSWGTAALDYDYDSDRWHGSFEVDRVGRWVFTIEAWKDVFGSWRSDLKKKIQAEQDVSSDLLEGARIVRAAARRAAGDERTALIDAADLLADRRSGTAKRTTVALARGLKSLMAKHFDLETVTRHEKVFPIVVDREAARFAAWYEMFPRSQGTKRGVHGTFRDAAQRLHELAELGFDVVYLPPIHPIGHTKRKGRNNALVAGPDDPGSPWAIGNEDGGHTAIEPRLGTLRDFERFVKVADELGMEVALDYALQCSPDHPWVGEHPDWFFQRPDGSIHYAENPPKKYEDIYPLDFWCEDWESLWEACRDILLFWIDHGVRTFRVDNPHTKPISFWEWVIAEVKRRHPDVIFLSEAFTRPKRMMGLAKIGFTQSYTYFTWRNTAPGLRDYLTELTQTEMAEYFRGNLFTNTPDILTEYLQEGGRPAFRVRLILAATLSPVYGIYSGFELCENEPVEPGSEEYLDSEKYQIKQRDWDAPGNINEDIEAINRVRRENRALQLYDNLRFHTSENESILFYHKYAPDNDLLIAVNVDPDEPQETLVHVPLDRLGLEPDSFYQVEDLLTGTVYTWRGSANYIRLDPQERVAHLFRLRRPVTEEGS